MERFNCIYTCLMAHVYTKKNQVTRGSFTVYQSKVLYNLSTCIYLFLGSPYIATIVHVGRKLCTFLSAQLKLAMGIQLYFNSAVHVL